MNLEAFKVSVAEGSVPPEGVEACLVALWWAAKGDWERAHEVAQGVETAEGSWVHAYLHRVEGDIRNARYWYARAGRPAAGGALEDEWENIVRELL